MLLIRLAYSYVAVHGFAGFLAGFVPKLFPRAGEMAQAYD